jgi:hypothetical protein
MDKQQKLEKDAEKAEKKAEKKAELEAKKKDAAKVGGRKTRVSLC